MSYYEREMKLEIDAAVGSICSFSEKGEHLEDRDLEGTQESAIAALAIGYDFSCLIGPGDFGQEIASVMTEFEINHFNHTVGKQPLFYESFVGNAGTTWSTLQLLQSKHDSAYHPDVVGSGDSYHLMRTALHLGSTNGKISRSILDKEPITGRKELYANIMIFSIKALTALNYTMPDDVTYPAEWN